MSRIALILAILAAIFLFRPHITVQAPIGSSDYTLSQNWSGYVSQSGRYTYVSGTWTVPKVNSTGTSDAIWVGIGGVTSKDLIQAGTEDIIDPSGTKEVGAFYETLPASAHALPLQVKSGDTVNATIEQVSKGRWQITVTNQSTGKNYQTYVNYASSLSSSEWIVEAPSTKYYQLPLDNFRDINITGARTNKNGADVALEDSGATPTYMVINGRPAAVVSDINSSGDSFTVSRVQLGSL